MLFEITFKKRKEKVKKEISNFPYFSQEEKEKIINSLLQIDTIIQFEDAYKAVEEKMNEIKKEVK